MLKKAPKDGEYIRRHVRIRTKVSDTPECPRLNVFRSSSNVHTQIIDDVNGVTLASVSSVELKLRNGGDVEATKTIGTETAKRATEKNITSVALDRGGYVYAGCVKALAEVVRVAGLKF